MVIQHNMSAMFANTKLTNTEKNLCKTSEKLSSGYRINRAADDAAGLTISEKMRWQIRGLTQDSRNAQDGISLIQTTEGALSEVHDILQRMNELAVQGANDTNTEEDRNAIQNELDALASEIDRISTDTKFNTRNVLDFEEKLVEIDADDYNSIPLHDKFNISGKNVYGKALDFTNVNSSNINQLEGKEFTVDCTVGCSQRFTFKFSDSATSTINVSPVGASRPNVTIDVGIGAGSTVKNGKDIVDKINSLVSDNTVQHAIMDNSGDAMQSGVTYVGHGNGFAVDGNKMILYAVSGSKPSSARLKAGELSISGKSYNLQVGALEGQNISLEMKSVNASSLGVNKLSVANHDKAGESITAINKGIENLSSYRSYLGAMQNRLEHTVQIDDSTAENTQSSESLIRDADMAEEMVEYSKHNILMQVSQSVLSQANMSKQGVLQLLG